MTSIIKVNNIQNSSGTSALTIDGTGNVSVPQNLLTPTRPAFKCRGYGSIQNNANVNSISIASGTDIIYNWDVVDINRNSAFNNSTGKYTVPVAGLYQVSCGVGFKSSSNYLSITLFLTSSDNAQFGNISSWVGNNLPHTPANMTTIVEATVGQEFAMGMSDAYSNPDTNVYYSWFSAYLIG
tara:strand:+ start:3452 stop:3997 length:546 start_codon:yes stop_codon:yes gene_type:complete